MAMQSASLGLVAALAALVYWALIFIRDGSGLSSALMKTASTALLALILLHQMQVSPGLWPVALGLALGATGDWFLARTGQAAFLAGMAAFGAGHLAYAGGLLARSADLGFGGPGLGEVVAAGALLALMVSTEVWLVPRTGDLRWPVRAYVVSIGLMGLTLVALPAHPAQGWLRLGGGLFILSDFLLALRLFVIVDKGRQRALSVALWPAYWTGQALIGWASILFWATRQV